MKKPVLLIAILVLLLILVASAAVASAARSATQSPPSLEGVRWVLVSFKDTQGKVASAVPGADAYAEFASGTVTGSTGCNNYTAPYQVKGNSLTVGLTATTMKACADPIMAQEQAYLADLQAAATYKIEGQQLSIADAKGVIVLTYKAETPSGLVGNWVMTAYNNGKGGFQSAMAGVVVTAVFDDKGQVSGNAGCNTYNASYTVNGNKIKIGPAATTRMACEPDVMAQETAYLNALTNAAIYEIAGNKLTLRDANGAAMAGYIQAPAAAAGTAQAGTGANASPTAAAPASQVAGDRLYLTLRPAADGSVQSIALLLKADGTAQFTQDFGKDQPITLTGTWAEANGLVTVTLTDKDGAKLATPMVMKFKRDGTYLTLTDYDKAVWGENGLKLNQAADIARKARSPLITIDLQAGFPLDPTFVSVNGGGEVDARVLGGGCTGYINRQPTVTVKWSGQADRVRAFFYSDGNPTLTIVTPKGQILCNDNATADLLDPFIEIANPVPGDYRIWVGSANKNQLIPGILVLTTRSDVDLGTFQLGKLITRPSIPMTAPQPPSVTTLAPQVQALKDKLVQGAPTLKPGAVNVSVDVTADGNIPLFRIPEAVNNGCGGLVTGAPSYAFKWTGKTANLHIAVQGDGDSTLMVVGVNGKQVLCNDDAKPGDINPAIDLANPAEDAYLVYIGRVSPTKTVTGKLTIAEGPKE